MCVYWREKIEIEKSQERAVPAQSSAQTLQVACI